MPGWMWGEGDGGTGNVLLVRVLEGEGEGECALDWRIRGKEGMDTYTYGHGEEIERGIEPDDRNLRMTIYIRDTIQILQQSLCSRSRHTYPIQNQHNTNTLHKQYPPL